METADSAEPERPPAAADKATATERRRAARSLPLAAALLAAVVALGGYLLATVHAAPHGAKTPEAAVRALLQAGTSGNQDKIYGQLCAGDRGLAGGNPVAQSGKVHAYRILRERRIDANHGIVTATLSSQLNPGTVQFDFPVARSHGRWQVCASSSADYRLPASTAAG